MANPPIPVPIGAKFGRLTVTAQAGSTVWAKCECGTGVREYVASDVRRGHTRSCGCLARESSRTVMRALRRGITQ